MTGTFKSLLKEMGRWSLWIAILLIGLPPLILLVAVVAGFCGINLMLAYDIVLRYIQIPAQFLDSSHVEPKMNTPITVAGWLSIPGFYLLLSLAVGIVIGLMNTIRKR